MFGSGLPALLQLALTALALLSGALLLVRKAAFRYFVLDASFDPAGAEAFHAPMSIGDGNSAAPVPGACAECRAAATKKCSRCKSVWYCSKACQSKHWESHKLKCKQARPTDKANVASSDDSACQRRDSSRLTSISLVPGRGKCMVLHEPKKILLPYEEFVKLFNWDNPGFMPCGLLNCGNSCYVNVVLQCLASTRPLIAYLLERDHSRGCVRKRDDWCFLCELQVHIQRAIKSLQPFSPINILSRLPNIGGNLGYGRQEDAHEFMRFVIDTMQSICLDEYGGENSLEPSTQETTLIQYIFGGHLQSQVICTKCNMISNRFENMLDLTVEIQGDAGSLEECLNQFTMKERLDGENMYKCDGCNDYVKAWKRLTIHQAPNILTIALKRFQSGRFGKLNKRVTFPEYLDLTPYMSENGDGTDLYTLYAVVVHVDSLNASFFGHYICYTKDYHGRWYKIDDDKVMNVDLEEVLNQGAYMLLYSRRSARREPFVKPMEPEKKKYLMEMAPEVPTTANERDNGHERNLSIKSNSVKEKELENMDFNIPAEAKLMPIPKGLGDVDMYDSDPSLLQPNGLDEVKSSISPNGPEAMSSVKPVQSNFISPQGISSIEVQAMDCEETCVNSNVDLGMENDIGSISIIGEAANLSKDTPQDSYFCKIILDNMAETSSDASVATSSSVPEPCVCSNADNCMEQDTGQISISEEAFKLSKYTPEDTFSSKNVHNIAKTSCSSSPTTTNSVLQPADDLRSNSELLLPVCGPSDSANGVSRLDDVSCGAKGTRPLISCMENGSRGKSKLLFSRGFLDRPARKKYADHEERHSGTRGVTHSLKANGCINGHVELDCPDQIVCENDASLESLSTNGKDIFPGSGTPFISCNFLSNSCKQSMNGDKIAILGLDKSDHCKTNCDGSTELDSLNKGASMNEEEIDKMEFNDSDHPCKASFDGSAEPDFTEQSVKCNGANLESLSANGEDTFPETAMFIPPSFVDKFHKKMIMGDNIAKKEMDKADHPCETNCNGYAKLNFTEPSICDDDARVDLQSANGKDIGPRSSMPFISRGFLNKSYRKIISMDRIADNDFWRSDHPSRTNWNGFAARSSVCQNGNKYHGANTP